MKKLLCLLLALIILIIPFSACTDTSGDGADTTDTNEGTDQITSGLSLIKDGKSDVVIIFPARNQYLKDAVDRMIGTIDSKFNVWLDVSRDDRIEPDDSRVEILIGSTNRKESAEAQAKLETAGDYLCELNGNKLVITGANDISTTTAISYFLATYVVSTSKKDLIFSEENNFIYNKSYGVKVKDCAGAALKDFTIVYPKGALSGEYYAALNLRYHLFMNAGIDIPVVDDSTAAKGKEILIGKTNRNLTPDVEEGKFTVSVKDGNLCVSANDLLGFTSADAYIINTLFSRKSKADVLTSDFSHTDEAETMPTRAGSYRIIYNNIWGTAEEEYGNRADYAAAFYLSYAPDVIALNELWDDFRQNTSLVKTLTSNGYVEVIAPAKTEIKNNIGNPENNVLPIFYNPERVKLIESAYYHSLWYDKGVTKEQIENGTAKLVTADDSKGVTIAVFEGLDANGQGNGEQFIVCNTHFTSNFFDKEYGNRIHGYYSRLNDIETLWKILQPYIEKYPDISILLGCDYNCNIKSDEIAKLKGYGFESCHDTAEVADNQASSHGYPTYNDYFGYFVSGSFSETATYEASIDHIFQYGNTIDPMYFDTITNKYTSFMSDHSPLLLDFNVVEATNE